ncbi:hypothetical protein FQN49_002878 [Arthroderma sp. PD_2]|nr:hypothetical protein FQN49_002878 [Arthroderma sp. PD_2]
MSKPIPWRSHYRALLREISYLPDPVANEYMTEYITSRFRKFTSAKAQETMDSAKIARLHTRIRRNLRLLQLANEGYIKSLERVILMSYGRIGRRKRILLRPLLRPDVKVAEEEESVKPFSAEWKPSLVLSSLLWSQSRNVKIGLQKVRRPVRETDLEPSIPKLNVFSRPLAEIRQVHLRQKWYANVLEKTFPPLPQEDWETLQRLVDGREPWSPPKRRKGPLKPPPAEPEDQSQESYLTAEFLVDGATKDSTFSKYVRGRPHHITRRLMRHMWERVCILTPLMWWDTSNNRWHFSWGREQPPPPIYRQLDPVKGMALFEGVHQKTGRIPLPQKEIQKTEGSGPEGKGSRLGAEGEDQDIKGTGKETENATPTHDT